MSNASMPAINPAPPRTAAERALSDAFARVSADLPGGGWVARVRGDAMRWFEQHGLPTRRIEEFKYTDLRERLKDAPAPGPSAAAARHPTAAELEAALGPLASIDGARLVFIDGVYSADLSRTAGLGDAVEQMPLAPLLRKAPGWLEGKFTAGRLGAANAVSSLNSAFMTDGLLIKIKPDRSVAEPILIVMVRASAEPGSTALRHVVAIEPGASATIVEACVALRGASPKGVLNVLTDVTVADGATLAHVKCALDGASVSHLSSWVAKVGANASYHGFQLTAGVGLARNEIAVEMAGRDSSLDLSGAFLARGSTHLDTTLVVDHKVPGCQSRELFKGVLADRARGVFQGKIIVRPGADKTDGKQMARALLLSEDAEFDSKPELEIYADDVACGHGATAAALDDDLMFYCRSRGIPEAQARALLIEAFIGDAMDRVENEQVREALMDIARQWLSNGAA